MLLYQSILIGIEFKGYVQGRIRTDSLFFDFVSSSSSLLSLLCYLTAVRVFI